VAAPPQAVDFWKEPVMFLLLAQSRSEGPFQNLCNTVTGMFSHGDVLAQPAFLVEQLKALSVVWAVVFLIVGVLCMLNGYRFYRIATISIAFLFGLFLGYALGDKIGAPEIVGGCLGLLLAVTAFPMMKYAVAVLGGLVGAFVGANLWSGTAYALARGGIEVPPNTYWIGALVGLLVFGMLAFILFKLSIVVFTSVSGSTVAVLGGLALLLSFEPWQDPITDKLAAHQLVIPLLVIVPALIGLILQEVWSEDTEAEARAGVEAS
jgi:hypothetical protein